MAKRTKTQITKDTVAYDEDVESSDDNQEMEAPQVASQSVMATRKIAGLGKRFGKKSINNTTATNNNISIDDNQLSQMKSLNANFLKSINDGILKNPVADLSIICTKYIDYINKVNNKKIEVKSLVVPKVNVNPTIIKAAANDNENKPNPFSMFASIGATSNNTTTTNTTTTTTKPINNSFTAPIKPSVSESKPEPKTETKPETKNEVVKVGSDSDSDSEDEKKPAKPLSGPAFVINELPKSKDYSFKFGKVPKNEPTSDSDDDIEIKGPTFQSNAVVKDSVFKLTPPANKKTEEPAKPAITFPTTTESKPSTGFSFGATTKPAEDSKKEEPSKPAFSFGNTTAPTSSFTFTAKKEDSKPTPAFSFGNSTITPAITETKKEESKPAFSFGNTTPSVNGSDKPADSKPAFSFGNTTTPAAPATSAFSFTPKTEQSKETEKSTEKPTTTFAFGNNSTTTSSIPAKPASTFNFTAQSNNNSVLPSKPTFNFSSNNSSTFSFGQKADDKSTESKSNPFNLGNGSFGTAQQPSNGSSTFTFNASKPASNKTEDEIISKEINDESNEVEADTVKGDFTVVKLNEKVEVKTGEENEETLISKRSKLSKFNSEGNNYDSVGLGELKVLKNKETGKFRILARSEGSSNILLNVLILKQLKYELLGDKKTMLRIPVVTSSGSLETYLARIKTQNDGEELLKAIQDAQGQL